jgi:hypothetical protein
MKHLSWSEALDSHHHYVVIENSRSHEKAFRFVAFLLMERENFLHAVRPVLLPEATLFAMLFTASFASAACRSKVVPGGIDFLKRSDPQVSRLRILWAWLVHWLISFCSSIE